MADLGELKKQYNQTLKRNKNAEEFFTTKPVEECMKYLDLFNQVTIKLSTLRDEIERLLQRKMTKEEILEGFKEVNDFC